MTHAWDREQTELHHLQEEKEEKERQEGQEGQEGTADKRNADLVL